MTGVRQWSPTRQMVLLALLVWVVGGALFLAGVRAGADLALGTALVLVVVATMPFPALRRAKSSPRNRLPGNPWPD